MVKGCSTEPNEKYSELCQATLSESRWLTMEVQVFGNSRSIIAKRVDISRNAIFCSCQIVIVQVDVQQIDVPGDLHRIGDIAFDNLARMGSVVVFESS